MKILLISNMYPTVEMPYYGYFVQTIENGLTKHNIFTKKRISISVRQKHKLYKAFAYFIFYIKIIFWGTFSKYDAIYVHFILHSAIPLLIVRLFKPSAKIIINIHGSDIKHNTPLNKFLRRFVKPILKKSALIVVPSSPFKKDILNFVNIKEKTIYVSPSGGVAEHFYRNHKQNKKDNIRIVIGFISKVIALKGWFVFADAMKQLKDLGIPFKAIVGGQQGGNEIKILQEYNLINEVDFVGMIDYKELPKYYSAMDIFIFPTLMEESLGLVALEAMANGTPVIASNIGAISDYLIDGKNGFFFKKGNVDDLILKIKEYYYSDIDDKALFSHNARKTALKYRHTIVIKELANKFNEIINN